MHRLSRKCQTANKLVIEIRKHTAYVIFQQFGNHEVKHTINNLRPFHMQYNYSEQLWTSALSDTSQHDRVDNVQSIMPQILTNSRRAQKMSTNIIKNFQQQHLFNNTYIS